MTDWLTDARDIRGVKLAGNGEWYQWLTGDRFERFERPGEYCMLPWIRVTTWRHGNESTVEAPLTQAEFVEFAPASAIEAPSGSTEGESAARRETPR